MNNILTHDKRKLLRNIFSKIEDKETKFLKKELRVLTDKSLLRYPGGKTRAINEIVKFFPNDMKEMCSPFFGGGSIEIFMAAKGVRVYAYDAFKPLVEFWQCVLSDPQKLSNAVSKYLPLSKDKFYELQKSQSLFESKIDRAAVFYVINRSSFSGSTLSGGMSPNHPRFTQSSVDRVKDFYNTNISVSKKDFCKSIEKHSNIFKYLDPPYLISNTLYGENGSTHRNFDHKGLFELLDNQNNWIMSYNDCETIKNLYKDYKIITPSWAYGMSKKKTSNEVLIFSKDLSK